jgi:hypothetical protein
MTERETSPRRFRLPQLDPVQATVLVGVAAAMIVAVLLNVIVARRYTRWDWTENRRYSLSPPTVQTLRDLPGTVQIWVLLGSADPLQQSVKQLLEAYHAETTKLDVRYIDPDRDVAALEDVKQRFKIETGRTEQGHVVADAIVVVAHRDRHWFLSTSDMVQLSASDETRVSPREEQALTGAIRNVLGGEKAKLCFSTGHGEMSPLEAGEQGLGTFRDVLEKDNYEVTTIDTGAPNQPEPFKGCSVAVIAGLRGAFTEDEAERLRTWLLQGGNLLVAASPISGDSPTGMTPAGLSRVLEPFGIALDDTLVIEKDEEVAFPGAGGIRFVAEPRAHAVTGGLVRGDGQRDPPRVVLHFARSMRKVTGEGNAAAAPLLETSESAFGLTSIVGASEWTDAPEKRPGDIGGPLLVAMAAERPKVDPGAPHGPRVVVIGSASVLTASSFREPLPVRGAALLVESSTSWLSAKPQILDVPERASVPAGIRITDESRSEIRRYVLLFMPATVALLGIAIALWRRAGEGAERKKKAPAKEPPRRSARDSKKKGPGAAKKADDEEP